MDIVKLNYEIDSLSIIFMKPHIEGNDPIFEIVIDQFDKRKKINRIIFNFEKVSYINSLGIAELISLMRYFQGFNPKAKFKFIELDKKIAKIFKMVELGNLADIETR